MLDNSNGDFEITEIFKNDSIDSTAAINFINVGRMGRKNIDVSMFPAKSGVYVLRFKTGAVVEPTGKNSNILKIGQAGNIQKRFIEGYNHANRVTEIIPETGQNWGLEEVVGYFNVGSIPQVIPFWYMYAHRDKGPYVDFYLTQDKKLERKFLFEYLVTFGRTPLANFSLSR